MNSSEPIGEAALRSILADAFEAAAERLRQQDVDPSTHESPRPAVETSLPLAPGEKLTLTVTEAAERLGISRSSAYEAVRSGVIPSLRLGRRLLVPTHALHQRLAILPNHG
jgi:excisionase family DNA binding protein